MYAFSILLFNSCKAITGYYWSSLGFYESKRSICEASFLIGNFIGLYLKQEEKCEKKCLGQISEEFSGFLSVPII